MASLLLVSAFRLAKGSHGSLAEQRAPVEASRGKEGKRRLLEIKQTFNVESHYEINAKEKNSINQTHKLKP